MRHVDATYYNKAKVEHDRNESRDLFVRDLPKMGAFWLLFYAAMGLLIPLRMALSRQVIWSTMKASLLFGTPWGLALLLMGAIFMRTYTLHKARYIDFSTAASLTVVLSFRLYGVIGIPLSFWDIYRVILPTLGPAGQKVVHDWWIWLILLGGAAGWYSGRSIGGLVGILAVWWSGSKLLKEL